MMAAVAESMKERTGRTLEEWVGVVTAGGIDPLDQNGVRRWLKSEHGVALNSQWAIADAAARGAGWRRPSVEEYVDQQYVGAKQALRPLFDRVREIVEAFGADVTMEGRSTYTPFVRRRQFAAVAAATRTRVDIGVRFVDAPESSRLVPSSAPGQATHRLSVTALDEITADVERLLRVAYEQNG
jgi:hypothetical protein